MLVKLTPDSCNTNSLVTNEQIKAQPKSLKKGKDSQKDDICRGNILVDVLLKFGTDFLSLSFFLIAIQLVILRWYLKII